MKFKKDEDGTLVVDEKGDPIAIDGDGNAIPLDKVVSIGKHQRVADELEEYKTKAGELETQISDLKKVAGDADQLKAKVEELQGTLESGKTEFEQRMAAKDKEYALDTALLAAGVPAERLKAAKALVDAEKVSLAEGKLAGLDVDTFKKDNAYLFDTPKPVRTAAAAAGSSVEDLAGLDMDEYVKARKGSE